MELKRRVRLQNGIIIALVICIILLTLISSTAAWYIVSKEDTATIFLANPVNVTITEHSEKVDNILTGNTLVYPGDTIQLKLGLQLIPKDGLSESSPAHVRAKLLVSYDNLTGFGDFVDILSTPSLADWVAIDYSKDPNVKDIWYVYGTSSGAKEVKKDEKVAFVDGFIKLSVNMTNKFSNKKLNVAYKIQAIQTKNTGGDPIKEYKLHTWYTNNGTLYD